MIKDLHHLRSQVLGKFSMLHLLKHILGIFITCLLCISQPVKAQLVSTYYTWSQSNQTYITGFSTTSVTPSNIVTPSWDDNTYTGYTFPFNFTYRGQLYTAGTGTIGIDTDGWVAFSPGAITMTGTTGGGSWVSGLDPTGLYLSGTANNDGFCGFNSDLEEQLYTNITGNTTNGSPVVTSISDFTNLRLGTEISGSGITEGTVIIAISPTTSSITLSANAVSTTTAMAITPRTSLYAFLRGIAPYRQFVIQWTRATRFSAPGDDFSFQLVLNEGGGLTNYQTLQAVYGTCKATNVNVLNAKVGLRGASAADYNARTTNTNWSATTAATANTQGCTLSPSVDPPTGLTFTWSPACLAVPSNAGAISGPVNVCPNSIIDYSIAGVPGAIRYDWVYTGGGTTLSGSSTLPLNTLNFGPAATGGTLTVTPYNLCGTGLSSSITIVMNAAPTATISYPSSSYCTSASPASVTQTGTAGGTYSVTPTGLTINASTGQVTPSTSAPGSYVVTYTFVSGCTATTTASIAINAGPTATATATPALLCSGSNSQLQVTAGGGTYSVISIPHTSVAPLGAPVNVFNIYTDETISPSIPMPIPFTFYGQNITNFYVSANGYIQLGPVTPVNVFTPQTIPAAPAPNNVVALAWTDLVVDPSLNAGANVRYYVNGTSPNQIMVIDFVKLSFYNGFFNAGTMTGQIRLYQSDNHIEVATTTVNDAGLLRKKTLGIENLTGTVALTPAGRNNVVWNVTSQAWSFYPTTFTYLWSPATFLSSTTISNPVATAVTSTTAYNVQVTNTSTGCSVNVPVTVTISAPLNGTYTVGAGGNYTTLTAAVNAYNTLCIGGPVTFSLIDNLYSTGETFPIVINSNIYASAVNTLTIKPAAGKTPLITGSSATSLIRLNGADYVTFDGSNILNGITRDMSITNTASTSNTVLWITSAGTSNGATNNSIKNCRIFGASSSGTIACILAGSGVTAGNDAEAPNNNNTIQNDTLYRAQNGAYLRGNTSSPDQNWLITKNGIGSLSVAADKMGFRGLAIQNAQNFNITLNRVNGVNDGGLTTSNMSGIGVYGNINTGTIAENKITDVKHTSIWGAHGIYLGATTTASNLSVRNNFIFDIAALGFNGFSPSDNGYGIVIDGGGGYKLYYNTAVLNTNPGTTNTTLNHRAAALLVTAAVTTASSIDLRNNIFGNAQTQGGANSRYAILSIAANTVYSLNNYNDFYSPGSGWLLCKGSNATQYNTLATLQANLGGNTNSVSVVPTYVNPATDLHVSSLVANSVISNLAIPIAGITIDYDTTTRNGLTPDIGADEWLMPNTGSWVGKTNIDWLVPTNWETNTIPTGTTDVTITGGYTFMPTIVTTQAINSLFLSAPGTPPLLTLNGGTLQINGIINRTGGTIEGSNGTVEMNRTVGVQSIPAGLFVGNNLKNLVIGNTNSGTGVTLLGPLDIYRSLTFSAPGLKLTTGNFLTFKSNATETAWLGNVTGKTITGQATVERYIPTSTGGFPNHGKSWQFLAVPIKGTQTVKAAWQEGAATPNANPVPGFGTQITSNLGGSTAGATALGFDVYTSVGPTMKTYDAGTNTYLGISNTNILPIQNQKGYMLYVRGNRAVIAYNQAAQTTVLRTKGTLFTTGVDVPPASTVLANKFESIGNPYASAIDFSLVSRSGGADNTFYVWDPLLYGTYGYGAFQTISAVTGWLPTPGGTMNYPSSTPVKTIQSGQAFFAHATGSNGTITFGEGTKIAGSKVAFRAADFGNPQSLKVGLFTGNDSTALIADGNSVAFGLDYSSGYDGNDALKFLNSSENFGVLSNEKNLAVEARPLPARNDTIFYSMSNLRTQSYQLRFVPENLEAVNLTGYLVDRFLDTRTEISLREATSLNFTVTSNANSYAAGRFYLVFNELVVVPVTITHISATRASEKEILVNWKVENEINIDQYEVERSGNGTNFNKISSSTPQLNNGGNAGYNYPDRNSLNGNNFYRIKAVGRNGQLQYSSIVKVAPQNVKSGISVYPNPVENKILSVSLINQLTGEYKIELRNKLGQLVYSNRITVVSNNEVKMLSLGETVASATYQLTIIAPDGRRILSQVIVQ